MNSFVQKDVPLLFPILISLHLYFAPYTKVEESFNIQAAHDILTYGVPLSNSKMLITTDYDHMTFPGAVPRTFVGALVLSEMSRPFARFLSSPTQLQTLVRWMLGMLNAAALCFFKTAVDQAFGRVAGVWFVLFQISQFHVMYYASRTLPNMLAFPLSTVAIASFILANYGPVPRRTRRARLGLYLLTIAGVIFRSELAILVLAYAAKLVLSRRLSLTRVVTPTGLGAATIGILISVGVDSFFWQRFPLWPEWTGFYFNTILGNSANWGTSPFHFYFLNALPRLMLNPATLFCIVFAVLMRPLREASLDILGPNLVFVAAYSILPHKEWRFIIYIIPALTGVASAGAAWIWNRRARTIFYRLASLGLIISIPASLTISTGLLYISSLNYPGAVALQRLHDIADGSKGIVLVHLDNLSCQTGVTRFQERPSASSVLDTRVKTIWNYDKTEDPDQLLDPKFWRRFDYVLAEGPERVIGKWMIVEEVEAYAGIQYVRAKPDRAAVSKDVTTTRSTLSTQVYHNWKQLEYLLRTHITGGRWIELRMEPRIKILKNAMPTWEQRYADPYE